MNKLFTVVVALSALGCSHVTHEELQRDLDRSQSQLRQEMADGDVASLECGLSAGLSAQAGLFCGMVGAYCNVVETYESHCLRQTEDGRLLPPVPGVHAAMERAIEEFNEAARAAQQNQTETTETGTTDSTDSTDSTDATRTDSTE